MRPWKHRKQVSTQGMIPSRAKADEHFPSWLQEHIYDAQDFSRILEVLKGIEGNDNLRDLLRRRREHTNTLNTCASRLLPCGPQDVFTIVNTDYPLGSLLSHFNDFASLTAPEIDNHLPWNLALKFLPQ